MRGTDEYDAWVAALDADAQADIDAYVRVLGDVGPTLGRPYVDTVKGSAYPNMKELRPQSNGRPFRIFFAFDPNREAILLLGGDKTGDERFYEREIARADVLYGHHLEELKGQ